MSLEPDTVRDKETKSDKMNLLKRFQPGTLFSWKTCLSYYVSESVMTIHAELSLSNYHFPNWLRITWGTCLFFLCKGNDWYSPRYIVSALSLSQYISCNTHTELQRVWYAVTSWSLFGAKELTNVWSYKTCPLRSVTAQERTSKKKYSDTWILTAYLCVSWIIEILTLVVYKTLILF